MAVHLINPTYELGGDDLRAFVRSLTVERDADEHDITNMGSGGARERIGGLTDGTVTTEFYQSFDGTGPYQALKDNLGAKLILRTDPTQPGMEDLAEVEVLIDELPEFTGSHGELSTFEVTWQFSTVPTVDPGALFTATMLVGTHATQDRKGFDRNSGARWGRLTPSDFADDGGLLNDDNADSRIISLFLDQSEDALYIRVNRKQDFVNRWIRVGPDWLEMHPESGGHGFTSGDGPETASYDITADSGWRDSIDNWTELDILPVGVYDRVPDATLPTDPNLLATVTMTVGSVGNEVGYKDDPGGYGTPSGGLDVTPFARDGEITIEELSYDTSASVWTFEMENSGDATRMNGLWVAVRRDVNSPYTLAAQVDAGTGTALAFVGTAPANPNWTVGTAYLVELWDRDPR